MYLSKAEGILRVGFYIINILSDQKFNPTKNK